MSENELSSGHQAGESMADGTEHWLVILAEIQRIQMQLQEYRLQLEKQDSEKLPK